ncbi:MAG: hypothetical protein H2184_07455 [Candidatus Galacturonibacter soehngenii]|nr:hypothetical protein [Candidatus Galacturonibacter soehngenii]
MNEKIIFREMLSEIRELAEAKGNKLSQEEINIFFKDVSLSEDQLELVYSYLEANRITIEGHKKSEKSKLFEQKEETNESESKEDITTDKDNIPVEEDKYLSMYLEEIEELGNDDEEEKHKLLRGLLENDPMAKSKLIELYLPKVVEIAKQYVNKGVALSDLIQEGNIGLMLTLDQIDQDTDFKTIEATIKQGIIAALEEAIDEVSFTKSSQDQIVSKVNFLNEGVKNLEEEMGRTVSIEELAKYLEMSKEEVEDIIRVSDDEIIVEENKEKKM